MSVREIIVPIGPSIAYVPLTRGLFSLIDIEDVPLVEGKNWCAATKRGYKDTRSTAKAWIDGKMVSMHRILTVSSLPMVDHANGNSLDNRDCNRRPCSASENNRNKGVMIRSASGVKGVYWNKKRRKWHSIISINGKNLTLGWFDNIEDASGVYYKKAVELAGEFARTSWEPQSKGEI